MPMHIEVTDVNGVKWVSDESEEALTDENREALHDLLKEARTLDSLNMFIGGHKTYFNPAHIITITIVEDES